MVITTDSSYYRARIVYSIRVYKATVKSVKTPWVWYKPLTAPEIEHRDEWRLDMDFLGEDEERYTATLTHPKQDYLITIKNNILKQIKAQDHEIMDRAFEDAVNNMGKK